MLILNELRAHFAEVRIVKDLENFGSCVALAMVRAAERIREAGNQPTQLTIAQNRVTVKRMFTGGLFEWRAQMRRRQAS